MASNKHPSGNAESNGAKRQHVIHTIILKVAILQKLDKDESVRNLRECYGVGNATMYIRKQHEKLLKFYAESDSNKGAVKHRTMYRATLADLNKPHN